MQDRYLIPKEIKSEIKLQWGFFVKDLIVIGIMAGWGWMTASFFAREIDSLIYILINAAFGVFLILKPASNPQKRNYQVIYLIFAQDRKKYKSFDL